MRIVLFTFVLALLLLQMNADNKYSEFARYENPAKKERITFSHDEESVILYSAKDSKINFFRSYDMQPTFDADCKCSPLYI